MKLFTFKKACTIAAILATTAGTAHADLVYSFSDASTFNGTAPTTSSTVYATATFSNYSLPNTVQLVMKTLSTILAPYYVNDWAFNFTDGTSISSIVHTTNDIAANTVTVAPNAYALTGGGQPVFDFGFNFSTASPGQLAASNTSTYLITGIDSAGVLNFNDFKSLSFNKNGTTTPAYFAAVHVQGVQSYAVSSDDGGGPSQGNVPEPASVALFGLGILCVALARRRTRQIDG